MGPAIEVHHLCVNREIIEIVSVVIFCRPDSRFSIW